MALVLAVLALVISCIALFLCLRPGEAEEPPALPGPPTFQYRDQTMTAVEGVPVQRYDRDGFRFDETGRGSYTWRKRRAKAGIDVSYYQKEIDWEAVAADGIDFAILRLGYRGYTEGGIYLDSRFEEDLQGAREAGLEVGAYFYSQAVTPEEAEEEAEFVLEALAGRPLDYPIAFDWETIPSGKGARTEGMSGETLTQCALAFCRRVREGGYEAAIYLYQDLGYFTYDLRELAGIDLWLAEYGGPPDFYYDFGLLQYTSSGQVAGIEGAVDLDLDLRGLGKPMRNKKIETGRSKSAGLLSKKWRSHFFEKAAALCAHSLSANGGQLAHLRAERYFSGVHAAGKIDR